MRLILAAVPPPWLADLRAVRLSNALQHPDFAYFNRYDGTLTIYARGRSPEELVAPILMELAAHSLGFKYRRGHRLSHADSQRVTLLVQPLAEDLLSSTQEPNKTDAGNGSYGICDVIDVFRSPSPVPSPSPKQSSPSAK